MSGLNVSSVTRGRVTEIPRPHFSRRGFLGMLGGAVAAAATFDPEKALWIPGQKTISIPKARMLFEVGDLVQFGNMQQIYRVVVGGDTVDARFQLGRAVGSLLGGELLGFEPHRQMSPAQGRTKVEKITPQRAAFGALQSASETRVIR